MADIKAIAEDFTQLCKDGKLSEAGEKYWSPDVVSVEAMDGDMKELRGLDALRGKGEWWAANNEVHDAKVEGPWPNGDQFIVRFVMDVTFKGDGQRRTMDETALYTVRDGKIVEERFFYTT